ncbi:MAG TPA: shikimate dehydrogenase [Oceanospirillales bacterium]|nr:shikimate dehydrogenase [Oceanospirillales bacterium]|tara:strand:+ start:468 stop:1310 length:843 start_codon:yes stop_codon:yes gene_type:complete
MSDLYAVMGNPINHSKSPQIHSAFAEQTQQDLIYSAILVPLEKFKEEADGFFRNGLGLNVTVPFKEDAWQYADTYSSRALRAGAVNTLIKKEDGSVHADNTDGIGMVRDITVNNGCEIEGKRVLVLGAGGAVRGILEPVLEENPLEIVLANRTVSKAEALAQEFSDLGTISGCGFDQVEGQFDLIINGTSASLSGDLPPVPDTVIHTNTTCYDMMYGPEPTVFNQWAANLNAGATLDGLGMLVEQAAESFTAWRGVRPESKPVIERMRANLLLTTSADNS